MGFAHCFLISFTYAKCKVTFFIKHFLISLILYEGSTLINFGFLIKGDIRYVVFIFDITGLSVCNIRFVYKILGQSRKLYNVKIPPKRKLLHFYLQLLGSKLECSGTWNENAFFRKIRNFVKSERFYGLFPNLIPNILEHLSLYKELFSSIAYNIRQLERGYRHFSKN